jgi:hypothetical protein
MNKDGEKIFCDEQTRRKDFFAFRFSFFAFRFSALELALRDADVAPATAEKGRALKRKAPGAPPAKKTRINFQPIGPDAAWHPKRGAPHGNRNALRAGFYTHAFIAFRRDARCLILGARAAIAACKAEQAERRARLEQSGPPA